MNCWKIKTRIRNFPFPDLCTVSQSRVSEAHSSWPLTDWTQPVQRIRQEGWEACRVSILLDYPHVLLSWVLSLIRDMSHRDRQIQLFQRPLSLSFKGQKSRSPQEPGGFNLYFWLCWTCSNLSPARQGNPAFYFYLPGLSCIPGTDNYLYPPPLCGVTLRRVYIHLNINYLFSPGLPGR